MWYLKSENFLILDFLGALSPRNIYVTFSFRDGIFLLCVEVRGLGLGLDGFMGSGD